MRRALRIALKTLKWLAIVGGTLLLVVVLVNLRDETLTPEAQAMAEFHRPSVPDAQNAYLAMVGFDAPAGVDPIVEGARIVKQRDAAVINKPLGFEEGSTLLSGGVSPPEKDRIAFIGDMDTLCEPLDKPPCAPPAPEAAPNIRAMTEANAELVARYLALQKLPAFANTSIPDFRESGPASYAWSGPRRLLFTQAALDVQSGHDERAIAFLAADIGLWRRVLGAGASMINEMVVLRQLASDFRALSDLIATPNFDIRKHETELRRLLAPLSPAERNGAPMFKRQFAGMARWAVAFPKEAVQPGTEEWSDRLLNRIFFKPNATLNGFAPFNAGLQTLASSSPAEFVGQRKRLQTEASAMSEPDLTWIYNPAGKRSMYASVYSAEFVAHIFDVDAYVRFVRAQFELRLAGVAPEKAPSFLAAAGPETRNPYTDQPFAWDAADSSLVFDPMSNSKAQWRGKARVPLPASPLR